ncbi:hypothetical protein THRCLA_09822 [Thraustotheca clavata]|uniref:Transmembrane protein n=1 Tax=Thraustotheca clavata TaxID=74557 RepID=A0A1V9YTY0_9STRA|nr:hypothetical protein THRCLA_09822 [Thraustotheca clavata]
MNAASLDAHELSSLEFLTNDAPLTWSKVILAVLSYLLFFTDIPRSGYGFKVLPTSYEQVTEASFSPFGPYNYTTLHVSRPIQGSMASTPSEMVAIWPYKFDTCSIGLRSLVQHFHVPQWDPCLTYDSECPHNGLPIDSIFTMLDNFISIVPDTTLRVEHQYIDKLHEYLAPNLLFSEREWRTVRSHVLTSAIDLCDPLYFDRALFCDQPWADFSTLGPSAEVSSIGGHIQNRMKDAMSGLNLTTQVAEMIIIESAGEHRDWSGGVTITRANDFDIVSLTRVRNCSDTMKQKCKTMWVNDYRYEGALLNTNVVLWYRLVRALRLVGQIYNITRVIVLFVGCFLSHDIDAKSHSTMNFSRMKSAMKTFLQIPAQVIIYGSWFPVILFATAHSIDCTAIYLFIFRAFSSLNGGLKMTWDYAYFLLTMMTCQMRSVWVLSVLTKIFVFISDRHPSSQTLLGFRGYVLPLVSFISIGFSVRLISIRNTNILRHTQVAQSNDIGAIRQSQTIPSNHRYWGLYLDARCLFMAFIILCVLLMLIRAQAVRSPSRVPYAVKSFCNHTMFSTSWNTLFIDQFCSKKYAEGEAKLPISYDSQHQLDQKLMNIAWMTDPIEYLSAKYWNCKLVHYYTDTATSYVFIHPLGAYELMQVFQIEDDKFKLVKVESLVKIPWCDRICSC